MGAKLCTLWHPISDQKSKSPGAAPSFKEFITPKCLKIENRRRFRGNENTSLQRKTEMETSEKKILKARRLTLEDWILASSPDHLTRGEFYACKQSKKKVHPCSSQLRGSLIGEAKDNLFLDLDRPMNRHEESEEMSNCSSIARTLSGKSQKRVSFELPHIVIVYSPDEPYCNEAPLSSPEEPYSSEDSFPSPMGTNSSGKSFDSAEEPVVRLAVDTLPRVFVSSRI